MHLLQRKRFIVLFFVLLLAVVSLPASAAVVLSNASGGYLPVPYTVGLGGTVFAMGFTVPAGDTYRLNSATLNLGRMINIGASASASIYSNSGGNPGSSIASLSGVNPTSTAFANYTFTSGSGVALSGGQTYWLVVTGTNLKIRTAYANPSGVFTYGTTKLNILNTGWIPALWPYIVSLDADAPVAVTSITRASSTPTNAASVSWNVTLGGNVTGLSASNFALIPGGSVSGASITGVTGSGASYVVTASTGTGDGTLGLNLANSTNLLPGISTALQFTGEVYTIDKTGLTGSITSTGSDPTNVSPIPLTITFSEGVADFDLSDVTVGNGTAGNLAGGPAVYTFDVTPAAFGTVSVSVAADAAHDTAGNGSAAAQFSIVYGANGLNIIYIALMNDGTDAQAVIPNPVPAGTPAFAMAAGSSPAATVDPVTGAFVYAFEPGAPLGIYHATVEVVSNAQAFNQLVEITLLPAPPPVPLCEDHNFDEGGVVRSGAVNDGIAPFINCRVLYQNGVSTSWLGSAMYSEANLGVPGLLDLGVQQAVDVFSPGGLTYFDGGAVFCLRGSGTLIWLAASGIPRHPEIVGSYAVDDFPGFTCVTLFEPGTLVLVSDNPMD